MRVVVDTNVLVSGLITSQGSSASIVNLILEGQLQPLTNLAIELEYREVLTRGKFHLDPQLVEFVLAHIHSVGERVNAQPVDDALPDPKDRPFLEVALSGWAEVLITGNKKHFPAKVRKGIKIMGPTEFLSFFVGEQ